jgi:hypothetical protein
MRSRGAWSCPATPSTRFRPVTSTLPQDIRDVFDRFITTEYVTVDAKGQPIAWPVTPYYSDGAPTIDITTGIGYPKKADDAARNPRVALSFSDPTGSGVDGGIRVLVQGVAEVDESDLRANRERYRKESKEKLPAAADMLPPKFVEGLFAWYFDRIYVKVRPERVFVWPAGDATAAPDVHDAHLEEVRSGHVEEPAEPLPGPSEGDGVWDPRIDELGTRYDSAVLAWVAPDGFPLAVRLPVATDASARRVLLGAEPAGLPLAEGPACVTAHGHAPDFTWQENFQVRGDLVRAPEGWALVPRKLVGGFELPDEGRIAVLRRNAKKARRFAKIARERKRARSG